MALLGTSRSKASELIAAADDARDNLKWAEAAKLYASALEINRNNPPIWVQLGHALKESGKLESAIGAYTQAIELDPQSSDSHLQLGHARKLAGDTPGAIESYSRALEIDPANKHAKFELTSLGETEPTIVGIDLPKAFVGKREAFAGPTLALDVSDLMHYFLNDRSPTGIQRVQINVVASLIDTESDQYQVILVCFTKQRDFWIEIDPAMFKKICRLALVGADVNNRVWQKAVQAVHSDFDASPAIVFPQGATLINLGTSWWLQNYFLMLRNAKALYGVKYLPFVHDCIPVIAPEHCVGKLTEDFVDWILGVFSHADGYLVNSRATRNDLINVARFFGQQIPAPTVVRLDGRFPGPFVRDDAKAAEAAWPEIQRKHALGKLPFILFVSTIESRKNHQLAFDVWLKLIKKRGLADVPMLVCVGRNGWLNEAALSKLKASELLRKRVLMLSNISDAELAALYRHCLFTIYPSSYEGWGLPVTEAFCYGKLPLISNSSSLPEAGGSFAEYFEINSERDFQAKLERLLDDAPYRLEREEKIKASFVGREWAAIAEQIASVGAGLARTAPVNGEEGSNSEVLALPAAPGVFHSFSRNSETIIWRGMASGEVYRTGLGWNECDDWGCWMKDQSADIAFKIAPGTLGNDEGFLVYLRVQGLPAGSSDTRQGSATRMSQQRHPGEADGGSNPREGRQTRGVRDRPQFRVGKVMGASPQSSQSTAKRIHLIVREPDRDIDLLSEVILPGEFRNLQFRVPSIVAQEGVVHLRLHSDCSDTLSKSSEGRDQRIATLGVCGFLFCAEGDFQTRMRAVEAVQFTGDLDSLRRVPVPNDIGFQIR